MEKTSRALLAIAIAALISAVWTEGDPRAEPALQFDMQPFRAATTSGGLITVEGTQIGKHLTPRSVVQLAYQRDPLLRGVRRARRRS